MAVPVICRSLPVDLSGAVPEPPDRGGHGVGLIAADHAPGHHHGPRYVQGGRCVPPTTLEVNFFGFLITSV